MIKVLIVGTGAIGGFYGAHLARQGVEVSVLCRSEYQHVKDHGIQVNSHSLGDWLFKPKQVISKVSDYQHQADYVILCTKVVEDLDRVALIRPAVSANTAVVFIQNGVEIETEMADAFPGNEVISGLAFICCSRIATGVIAHTAYGRLTLGSVTLNHTNKTQQLSSLFQQSGIESLATDEIVAARWQKCVWNAPFSPLSVLSGGLSTEQILSTQESLIAKIMAEVCAIAAATGHALPDDIIQTNIANTYAITTPYKTSMLLDFEAGRAMETEAILGNTVRAARRTGIDSPYLESLYALMKLRVLALA